MKLAFLIFISLYGLFVLGYVIYALRSWRDSERLHRMAAAERARRHHEICKSKVLDFPQAPGELPAGIKPPSTARKVSKS